MKIIYYEMRKLLNWKVLGCVLLISLLFFQLFIQFELEHFPNGRPAGDDFHVAKQMIEEYGTEMDEKEFSDFKEIYQAEADRAGEYLKSREDFVEAGVTSYEQFRDNDEQNETLDRLHMDVMFDKGIDVFWELQAREGTIESYEKRNEIFLSETDFIHDSEWQESILEGTSILSILPHYVFANYNNIITMFAILIVISVMIVVGRIFITDQQNNALYLQYTTKIGRHLFRKKIIAAMLTTFLITSVYIGVLLILYANNHTQPFFQSKLHSFDASIYSWFDLTFLQYISLTIIGIYLLAFAAAAITIFLSRVVSNYISLIGAQVPVVVIVALMISEYLISELFSINYPLYLTIGTYCGLLVLGAGIVVWRWKKEQRIDIA